MKKFIAITILPLLLMASACGGQSTTSAKSSDKPSLMNINKLPPSFDGKWVSTGTDKDVKFEATIKDRTIRIDWAATPDNPTTALYWQGSFSGDSSKIVSQGDLKKMSTAMLASTSKTKTFTYKDGKLVFSFTIAGMTSPVYLKKDS